MPSSYDILTRTATAPAGPSHDQEVNRERAITIGLVCTLLFHVFLFWVAPRLPIESFVGEHRNLAAVLKAKQQNQSFDFQLADDTPPKPDPTKFVETNPDAPENTPDKTNNFSNRNQQSAQKEAAKELDPENRPSIQGRDDIKNDSAIVAGDHAQPQQGAAALPSASQTEAQAQAAQQARAEQVPLSGFDKTEGKNDDGVATNISQSKTPSNNANEFIEGAKDAKQKEGGLVSTQQVSKQQPKPRPRLTQARQNVLQNRIAGTQNVGVLGIDARWSEYGDYMQELIEIIQESWYSILRDSRISPKSGSNVTVTFKLTSQGDVQITAVEETTGKPGSLACQTAITQRAPYRKWTDQMVSVLGTEQSITFQFYYW